MNGFDKVLFIIGIISIIGIFSFWIYGALALPKEAVLNQLNPLSSLKNWLEDDNNINSFIQYGVLSIVSIALISSFIKNKKKVKKENPQIYKDM